MRPLQAARKCTLLAPLRPDCSSARQSLATIRRSAGRSCMTRVLYFLFVLSGAAGLIYESIWTRYLGLFVGHGAYAQIIVLVIFLGGMSVGALAISRWSERLKEPLYGYVAVEFAVGLIGIFFHEIFQAV